MDITEFFGNGFESSSNGLFRRKCVECPSVTPPCPVCPSGQSCVEITGNCEQCNQRSCVDSSLTGAISHSPTPAPSTGPNIGAIVGGVIGGVVFIALVTWLVWRFCIKTRRQQWEDEIEIDQEYEPYTEKSSSGGYMPSPNPGGPPSLHTRQSVASTAYTRGSNVIQIAFIPGITDRSEEGAGYVPPVPPIPAAASSVPNSPQSPYTDYSEDHYFMPGDLRDSTYSGFTDDGASTMNRQSTAASIAPSLLRQSVASTVYGGNVVENPMPAQTALRGRPLMVSVKSSANTSRSASTAGVPTVPKINYEKYTQPGQADATAGQPSSQTASIVAKDSASSFKAPGTAAQAQQPATQTRSEQSPTQADQSGKADLMAVIEEATRQASRQPVHGGLGSVRRDPSPFSDEHRIPSSGS